MKRRPAIAALLLALAMGGAQAQNFPKQPIKLLVPYPAGGGADVVARLVAQHAGTFLGQPVIVENKPGAGTIVAVDTLIRSKADGYTLMFADSSTMSTNPYLYKKLPYRPERDLMPVTLMTNYPFLLVSRNGFPAGNVAEVLAYARANPGKVTFASGGPGSPHHLAFEVFAAETKINVVHVPYKGAAAAIQDLIGGQVDLMFLDLAAGHNFIREGKLRAYAAATTERVAKFPDLPTMTEAGQPGFVANTWTGIVAPAGTPQDVITKLNDAFVKALRSAPVQAQLATLGVDAIPGTPARFAEHARSEAARLGTVIKAINLSLD